MSLIWRKLSDVCLADLLSFPILTITGPRQSGKSTLLRSLLPDWKYVTLEEPASLDFALSDVAGFVAANRNRVIIDEIQRAPKLLPQLQVEADRNREVGRFALTGSHNLLLLEGISQSLAGRTSIRHLLPFSYNELSSSAFCPATIEQAMFCGGYPSIYNFPEAKISWLDSYIETYIERDVRLIRNVHDLVSFRRFVKMCAGRVGQLLDLSSLGNDVGITHNTAKDWIGILETGFICFRLQPYFKNFSKRIIKSPKLYFYDTGVLCRLLGVSSAEDLSNHPFRGAIFENWCLVELLKRFYNQGERPELYFWRDKSIEVDILAQIDARKLLAYECKSGATPVTDFISAALKFKGIAKDTNVTPAVIFGGDQTQKRSEGVFYSWRGFGAGEDF